MGQAPVKFAALVFCEELNGAPVRVLGMSIALLVSDKARDAGSWFFVVR